MYKEVLTKEGALIFTELSRIKDVYLAGGTALALQIAHRISEIAATKAYTIGRRGSFKDYVDVYFVMRGGHSTLQEISALAEKKFQNDFNARLFLEQLIYFDDVQDTNIVFVGQSVDKKEIQKFFETEIDKLHLV